MKRLLLGCLLAACCSLAQAHKPSDAYLTLIRDDAALSGQLDIALRDLDNALGLDANGDGDVTWGELRAREADVAAYALDRLRVASAGEPCALRATRQLVDAHTDGTYAVLMLSGACATNGPTLAIDYTLFRDLDPQHRGLLNFVEHGASRSVVFSAEASHQVVGGDGIARQRAG